MFVDAVVAMRLLVPTPEHATASKGYAREAAGINNAAIVLAQEQKQQFASKFLQFQLSQRLGGGEDVVLNY